MLVLIAGGNTFLLLPCFELNSFHAELASYVVKLDISKMHAALLYFNKTSLRCVSYVLLMQ